eukprot:CAMPEP_0205803242 /NCGR_PEP_ID=MMETSP0205-20121125/5835_1 /ASSEMBLY_ACC=CAM_ASM_000278 /TAXON_ID=36767 /ORGANISM="Euplotes focardii, Strain TN1" /LENGTH=118 /DNA_ID=CAMNT_0053071003 /DNA_START=373 /DNA_END=729 /DNA_ORIENTATION=-
MKCDIWSLGVILYYMVTKTYPIKAKNTKKLMSKIATKERIGDKKWNDQNINKQTKHLIKQMLQVNPDRRFGIRQVLKHPFFVEPNSEFEEEEDEEEDKEEGEDEEEDGNDMTMIDEDD